MRQKLKLEDILIVTDNLGYELINREYFGCEDKLILKDREGYYYSTNISRLKGNHIPEKFHKNSNPYTIKNIMLWCEINKKPFKLLSNKYEGNSNKLKWQCLKECCGEIFETNWNSVLNGNGCGYCCDRPRQIGVSNCLATKNPTLAKEWHPTKNGNLTTKDITEGSNKNVWWQCAKNNTHEWKANINDRKINGCPYCSGRYATPENNLLINNPYLCKEWDYIKNDKTPEEYVSGSGKRVYWICKDCNHGWKVSIVKRTGRGDGCPECNKSHGEKICSNVLTIKGLKEISQEDYDKLYDMDKNINTYFIPQKEFQGLFGLGNGLLSYDFYIPKYNLLIEYQGEYHDQVIKYKNETIDIATKRFLKQQEHDRRKKEYALSNNYNFLEIWYWDFDNIETILTGYLNNLSLKIHNQI